MNECKHNVLRKIQYPSAAEYICADDEHPECHMTFVVLEKVDLAAL